MKSLPTIIAGPCSMESIEMMNQVAKEASVICGALGFDYIFKSSFLKANRSSLNSYTGPGLEKGIEMLRNIRGEVGVMTTTDIHEPWQAAAVAPVVDVIQVPALLSRQTDLILAASSQGRIVNIKKGQFMSPWKLDLVVEKARSESPPDIILTERGSFYGYEDLVIDFRALEYIRRTGALVGFDATHSIQTPSSEISSSGGNPEFIQPFSVAAAIMGVDYLFFETHPNPAEALSDGACMLRLDMLEETLVRVKAVIQALSAEGPEPPLTRN